MYGSILVSGGNGFLGSYIVDRGVSQNYEVTVVDDLSTSKGRNVPEKVNFIHEKIEKYDTDERYDYVIHLAARPSPEDYISHPVDTISSNSLGTLKMLEIARKGDSVFMYTSSSEVYGNAGIIPTPESYYGYVNPNGIRSCYDEGKRFSEALIMAYYGRVIPRFIMQALKNEPLTIHGQGTQTRSFLYIDDWVDASWKFLTGNYKGEIINIGSDKEITILELARKIIHLSGSSSGITFLPERKDDPMRRAADLTNVKNILKWEPRIPLEEGLDKTIEWFKVI